MPKPLLMGILNVTPDSFSDGGLHFGLNNAIDAAHRMIDEGADILDIGGESTRPGAEPVDANEEIRRTLPIIEKLAQRIPISIDTSKPEVAKAAVSAGAKIVNDVRALSQPGMAEICAEANCKVCLMHMQGEPRTMQLSPTYDDVVQDVLNFLKQRAAFAFKAGIHLTNIWLDPGIGFGKTTEHNFQLLGQLDKFTELEFPILIGVSRKAFIGRKLATESKPLPADQRLEGTLAAQVLAQQKGAAIIRAHDVGPSRRAIDMTTAILKYY